MGDLLSTPDMARLMGLSEARVRQLAARGTIPQASRGKFDPFQVMPAYLASLRAAASGRAGPAPGELQDERLRIQRAKRIKLELEAARMAGAMVDVAKVRDQAAKIASIVMAAIGNLPARLSDELAGMTDPHEIHRRIESETDEMIEEVRRAHWIPNE